MELEQPKTPFTDDSQSESLSQENTASTYMTSLEAINMMNALREAEANKPRRARIPGKRSHVLTLDIPEQTIEIKDLLVLDIAKIAEEVGIKLYIVGGYVRDYLLDRPRTDFDFTVVGDALEFAEILAKKFKSRAILYPRFKTAMINIGRFKCEFVGTRKEEYLPNSRNPIVTDGRLEDDLRRRDFTINAIAVSLNKEDFGTVIDIFKGRNDINKKLIRTPLEPFVTFSDDPLRMMRAARFSAQLGFKVDIKSIEGIRKMASRIEIIAQERITEEFLKILAAPVPSIGLKLLFDLGVIRLIIPELDRLSGIEVKNENGVRYAHKDILQHSFQVLDNIATKTDNIWLRFAALFHDIAKPSVKKFIPESGWSFHGHEEFGARLMHKLFNRLRLPVEKLSYVEKLVRLHQRPMNLVEEGVTDSAVRRLAFHAGDALEDLFLLCRSDITTNNPELNEQYLNNYDIVARKVAEVQEKDKLREFQSPVRGEEIMEICNLQPCRCVGSIKTMIEEAILDGIIPNEYEAAKSYFLENKEKWLDEINHDYILLKI